MHFWHEVLYSSVRVLSSEVQRSVHLSMPTKSLRILVVDGKYLLQDYCSSNLARKDIKRSGGWSWTNAQDEKHFTREILSYWCGLQEVIVAFLPLAIFKSRIDVAGFFLI